MKGPALRALCCSLLFVAAWSTTSTTTAQDVLLDANASWLFFRGTEEPPADWNTFDFDDRDWEEGPAPFGYETGTDAEANTLLTNGTTLADMQNSYLSIYLRTYLTIERLEDAPLIQLGIRFDDAFVAYVNGVEISRTANYGTAGQPVPFDTSAPSNERAATRWIAFPPAAMEALQEGENVIAIQGGNQNLTSSDFIIHPEVRAFSSVCPADARCSENTTGVLVRWTNPTGALYETVEIFRNGRLIGSPTSPRSLVFADREPIAGESRYEVVATFNEVTCSGDNVTSCSIVVEGGSGFRRGDSDGDGNILLTDAVFILNRLFRGGDEPECPDTGDTDDDGVILLTDGIYLLTHLFRSGPAPVDPGPDDCGEDPTEDELGQCVYTSC